MSVAATVLQDPTPVLSLRNVSVTFGGVKALQDVSFEVLPGEVQCIAGENGSGKSTLIKVITGVYRSAQGSQFEVAGKLVETMTPTLARLSGIVVIWQDLALFNEMTVAENIAIEAVLGAAPRVVGHAAMRKTALDVLSRLGAELDVDARLNTFAIAQRQIVAIARALVGEAKIIFMDEPTSSLTQSETNRLLEIVRTLSAQGIAIVFVSHRLAEVLEISSRVTVLRDGKLVGVFATAGMSQSRLTELMTGKTFDQSVAAKDHKAAPVVLSVEGLSRRGDYHDVSLMIRKGETLGLTGLLGAGRTELALSIFGMLRPDSGTIAIDGVPLDLRSNRDAIRAGIGYLSEDRLSLGVIQPQSIADNLVLPVLDKISRKGINFKQEEATACYALGGGSRHKDRPHGRSDFHSLRWQSAARCDRQVAGGRSQTDHFGLPNRRRRRWCPGRHLRNRTKAGATRIGNSVDLRRSAGSFFQRRSCFAHGGRQDRGRV